MLVVAAALRDAEGRWLMHRRPPQKHHGGLWEFPGGKVENDEFPIVALARELSEEIGISVKPGDFAPLAFASSEANGDENHIVILLYTLQNWEGQNWEGDLRSLEGGAVKWFAFDELSELAMPPLDITLVRKIAEKDAA